LPPDVIADENEENQEMAKRVFKLNPEYFNLEQEVKK
jgi:hypothetical protein